MCINCNQKSNLNFSITFATCKVCELIDEDKRNKGVVFCDTCQAYICESCWTNSTRRAAAALVNYGTKAVEKVTEAIETVKKIFKKEDE